MTEQTVNAYHVSSDFIWSPDEDEYPYHVECMETIESLVFAYSRGQARALFCKEHDFIFTTKMSIQLIRKDVCRNPRIANDDDPIWFVVTAKFANGSLPTSMLIPDTILNDNDLPDTWGKTSSYTAAIEGN